MNLIGIGGLDDGRLAGLLERADRRVEALRAGAGQTASLQDKSIALVFTEPSTRTRVSFEVAARRLGAHTVRVGSADSSIQKGESVVDTCRNLDAMGVDALVVRHSQRQMPWAVADRVQIPLINAGNGSGEHPTQALIDMLTLRRAFGRRGQRLAGKRVAIIGDIVHSRVARSDARALSALGCEVVLAGPSMLVPQSGRAGWDGRVVASRDDALAEADAVIMLRVQRERIHGDVVDAPSYLDQWGLDEQVVSETMKTDAFILHPGPVIRGMELSAAVADGPRSLILEQVSYAVGVRQAVLLECLDS